MAVKPEIMDSLLSLSFVEQTLKALISEKFLKAQRRNPHTQAHPTAPTQCPVDKGVGIKKRELLTPS